MSLDGGKMKRELKGYFERFTDVWQKFNNSYPKVAWDESLKPIMYIGEPDKEQYISWQPIEKNEISDLGEIEHKFGIHIHDSIKQYFNSYWFAELKGYYNSYNIILEPVLPGRELDNVYAQISGYYLNHGDLNNIPIGFEGVNNFYIVIDNNSGQVKLEDYERNEFFLLAESLEELISGIKFNS